VRLDQPSADGASERTISYDHIDRARTVFVWQAAAKPSDRARTRPRVAAPAAESKEAPAS
jgi:hypothetical protein